MMKDQKNLIQLFHYKYECFYINFAIKETIYFSICFIDQVVFRTIFLPTFTFHLLAGGRTLQIIRAKVSDGGEYTCIAINQAGESKKKVSLTVHGLFLLSS
jgi:hypothetical protein